MPKVKWHPDSPAMPELLSYPRYKYSLFFFELPQALNIIAEQRTALINSHITSFHHIPPLYILSLSCSGSQSTMIHETPQKGSSFFFKNERLLLTCIFSSSDHSFCIKFLPFFFSFSVAFLYKSLIYVKMLMFIV